MLDTVNHPMDSSTVPISFSNASFTCEHELDDFCDTLVSSLLNSVISTLVPFEDPHSTLSEEKLTVPQNEANSPISSVVVNHGLGDFDNLGLDDLDDLCPDDLNQYVDHEDGTSKTTQDLKMNMTSVNNPSGTYTTSETLEPPINLLQDVTPEASNNEDTKFQGVSTRALRNRLRCSMAEEESDAAESACESDPEKVTTSIDPDKTALATDTKKQNQQKWHSAKIQTIDLCESDVCKLNRNRKSESTKCLCIDKFPEDTSDIANWKDAKLKTEKPLTWFHAIQKHILSCEIDTGFSLKRRKNKKISIVRFLMVFLETKKIELTINFDSGVLHVKGSDLDQWIKKEFEKIKQHVVPVTSTTDGTFDPPDLEDGQSLTSVEKNSNELNVKEEISSIWEDIKSLRTAISSIESGLLKLTVRLEGIDDALVKHTDGHRKDLEKMEKDLDVKVVLFQETSEASMLKRLEGGIADIDKKMTGVTHLVDNFKTEVYSRLDSFGQTPVESIDEIKTDIEEVRSELNKADTTELMKGLNEIDAECTQRWSTLESAINGVRSEMRKEQDAKVVAFRSLEGRIEDLQAEVSVLADASLNSQTVSNVGITAESKTVNSNNVNIENDTTENARIGTSNTVQEADEVKVDNNTKLVMCMDSNSKFLIPRKLWDIKGTDFQRCYTIHEVKNLVQRKITYTNLQYFMISVGCNDLDRKSPVEVFNSMKEVVTELRHTYPGIKVILAEVTPRMDDKDQAVEEINVLINNYKNTTENIYIIKNSNLRDPKFFYPNDSKHIRKNCIGLFASNIKRGLRAAYGRKKWVPPPHDHNEQYNRDQQHNQHHQQHPYLQQQQQQQQQQQLQQQQLQQLLQWYLCAIGAQTGRTSDSRAINDINGT